MKHNYTGYAKGCRCDICRTAMREYGKHRREKQHDGLLEKTRQWRKRNKPQLKAYNHAYHAAHIDRAHQRNKHYMQTHRDQVKEQTNKWRKANPDKVRLYKQRERIKNRKRYEEYWREHYAQNRERLIKAATAYFQTARGKFVKRIVKQNRRAAKGYCSREQFLARWEIFGGLCWMCHQPATEMDHVIPLAKGGMNWPANLRPACRSCNASKGTKKI